MPHLLASPIHSARTILMQSFKNFEMSEARSKGPPIVAGVRGLARSASPAGDILPQLKCQARRHGLVSRPAMPASRLGALIETRYPRIELYHRRPRALSAFVPTRERPPTRPDGRLVRLSIDREPAGHPGTKQQTAKVQVVKVAKEPHKAPSRASPLVSWSASVSKGLSQV